MAVNPNLTALPGDTDNKLLQKILNQLNTGLSGGGGGGGGAVTIADGSDVAEGAKADAAVTNPASSGSVVALLKGLLSNTGAIGGATTIIKSTAVVTASAYSAGNAVGGKRTLSNAVRTPGTGILQAVTVLDRANQKAPLTIFIFDADPTAATITDKSAFSFSTDDLKVIAQVNINTSDYVSTNSKALATVSGLAIPLKAASGTTLYAAVVTSGTPTFAATTDVQIEFGIFQD